MVTFGKDVRLFVNGVELKQFTSVTWEVVAGSPTTCERHKKPVLYTNGYCLQCLDEEVCAACEGGEHTRCRELGESTAPQCRCPCTTCDCGPRLSGEGHQIDCPAYPYGERR